MVLKSYERNVTAKQGKATRALLELLTKLKVNRKCVEALSMHKFISCEPGQYKMTMTVRVRTK